MKSKTKTTFTINSKTISQLREVSSVENISMSKLIESLIVGYLIDYESGYREYGVIGYRAEKTDVSKHKTKQENQRMKKEQSVTIAQVQSAIDEAYIAVAAVEHKGCKQSLTNLLAFLVGAKGGDLAAVLDMAKWIIANARLVTNTVQINNAARASGFAQAISLDPFQHIDLKTAYDDFQRQKADYEVKERQANKNKNNNI